MREVKSKVIRRWHDNGNVYEVLFDEQHNKIVVSGPFGNYGMHLKDLYYTLANL